MTIKDAARLVEIKYENAKAIYRVYRREQRTDKRRNRFRAKGGASLGGKTADARRKAKLESLKANKGGNDDFGSYDDEDNEQQSLSDSEMDN